MRKTALLIPVALAALSVACGGGDSTGPSNPTPSTITIAAGNNQSATVATAVATAPAVVVRDQRGDAMAGVTVSFAVTGGGGAVTGGTAITGSDGSASVGSWTLGTAAGANTLSAGVAGLQAVSFTATAVAGQPAALAFVVSPPTAAANGLALTPQPVLQLNDQFGNAVSQAGVQVQAALTAGGGNLTGATTAATAANGRASFATLAISGTVGPRTLSFTATGLPQLNSGSITLGAGPAASVTANSSTSLSGTAGTAVTPVPSVLVQDQSGNPVAGATVNFAVSAGGGSVTGGSQTTNAAGIATVTNWTLGTTAGTPNSLSATVGSLTPVAFTATVAAGPAAGLAVVTQPGGTSAVNGNPLSPQPTVRVVDQFGNPVAAGVQVAAQIATGAAALSGATTVTSDGTGLATFTDLVLTGAAGAHTLRFLATGLTSTTSAGFGLTAGPAQTLALVAGDAQSATVNTAVPIVPSVLVTDQSGNPVSGVAVSFAVSGGGGAVAGGSTTTDAAGNAAPASWTLGQVAGPNTLTATAAGLTGSPVQFSVTGTAGAATQLVLTTQPGSSGAQNGVVFADQPVLALQDAFGNAVAQAGVQVTASIATGGGTLSGTLNRTTDAAGTVSYTDLQLTGAPGARTLQFSSTGLTGATSASFSLAVGPANKLELTTQPSGSVVNGAVLAQAPVVELQDAGGNTVATAGVDISVGITGSPAGISLGGTLTQATAAGGSASFPDLALHGTASSYTLRFTATGLTPATSGGITVLAGPASSVTANTPLSQGGRVGVSPGSLPSVTVRDDSGNPVAGAGVTFAVTAGGGALSGATPTTDALGVATVGGWTLGTSAVTNTVTATVGALPPVSFDASAEFKVDRVAAGAIHTCVLTVDGVPYCWGENLLGAIGDSSNSDRLSPVAVAGGHRFGTIAAGRDYSCGLTGTGAAWCWGGNNTGQLGIAIGDHADRNHPAAVGGGLSFTRLSASIAAGSPIQPQTCALTGAGAAWCWGSNIYGQYGGGGTLGADVPQAAGSGGAFSRVSAGTFFTCAVRSTGAGACWGLNGFGQLGDSSTTQRLSPMTVAGGVTFTAMAASTVHSCGIAADLTVRCWGFNGSGRLAQDTLAVTQTTGPVPVSGLGDVVQLVAGEAHTCARTSGNQVYCWGLNELGQLGDGTQSNRDAPTAVSLPGGVSGFVSIDAGASHTCGVTAAGAVYCWGDGTSGQLGDGNGTSSPVPVLVSNP